MILTGKEIAEQKKKGNIIISPWDDKNINPNSYNLHLHDELVVYNRDLLDMKWDNPYTTIKIPETGYILKPGQLYLARTEEYTETTGNLVPMLEGRSSIGRLGLFVHVTAGFGDTGFRGYWTLEMHCVKPIRIYPHIGICQIYYHTTKGETTEYGASGKYQMNHGIQTSQLWKELKLKEWEAINND